jgi:hypothetical protein
MDITNLGDIARRKIGNSKRQAKAQLKATEKVSAINPAFELQKDHAMQLHAGLDVWTLFVAGHGLHVLKRASLSAQSRLSGTRSRTEWLRTNALTLTIRFFINAAAFSYWIAHPEAATHAIAAAGMPLNLTLQPDHATAALFGLSGDSMIDWAAAKVPFLQKEIPVVTVDP